MKSTEAAIGIREIPKAHKWLTLSIQHLFAMFGATILVPFLTGLSPAVALVSSGFGTLAYLLITRGRIPAYLGSSFAFIYPIVEVSKTSGVAGAMIGSFLAGLVYGVIALLITMFGLNWLLKLLPPVVVGPVIIVIGLGLASTAIDMAMYLPGEEQVYSATHFTVALVTLGITILATVFLRGFLSLLPILFGIIGGYVFALTQGIVDTTEIQAEWQNIISAGSIGGFMQALFHMPEFLIPFKDFSPTEVFSWHIVFIMVPFALVTITEHIGDQMVLSKVVGNNFLKDPGLNRSIMGDGVATMIASFLGGPPNTTYGENIGVLAITKVYSVFVIGGAAVVAIFFGFMGMSTAIIGSIPSAVMGGVSILLFGTIASSGLRMLIDNQVDFGEKRNLIIASVILVLGVGGAFIQVTDDVQIAGMALAAIVGVLLNLILPGKEKSQGNGRMFEATEMDEQQNDGAA
ncbi:NCS2 family nucleobase:cation symporter [Halobacillus shinanisalinarum]|uniref:NCS2 family nucleobase:cation symporter n=1 Tax=Halobacillus shinanisalinarum TaxID=2932258 RepID=A0ABY4GYV7_9BACI|nr:solute carrier family 23 protein [Halobacillus shinanisalinarum]UOQ93105.1 NCS2 family nucleobase:cation symporter [Halobacillus shinanisalinarum]